MNTGGSEIVGEIVHYGNDGSGKGCRPVVGGLLMSNIQTPHS